MNESRVFDDVDAAPSDDSEDDWEISPTSSGSDPPIPLNPGESKTISVEVTPAENELAGTYIITSKAKAGDADATQELTLEIEEVYELDLSLTSTAIKMDAGGSEGIAAFAEPLAEAVRNRFDADVEVSASRMVVDAGVVERDRQVGQTGKVVKPDIYLALGISGSAQHRAGMDGSHTIVSVNSDAEAPIRHISDVFVHGRVEDVVPELIRALSDEAD